MWQKTLTFLKKYRFWVVSGSLVLTAIAAALWFQLSTPVSTDPVDNPDLTSRKDTTFGEVSFIGEPVVPPASLSLYTVKTTPSIDNVIAPIIDSLNLTKQSEVYYQGEDNSYTLVVSQADGFAFLTQLLPEPTIFGVNPNQAQQTASLFLESIGLNPETLIASDVTFLDASFEPEEVSQSRSALARVEYVQSLQSLPVVFNNQPSSGLWVLVTADNQVAKVQLTPLFGPFEEQQAHKPLSTEEALAQIQQGNYQVLDSYYSTGNYQLLSDFARVVFNNVRLEYRILENSSQVFPYYHFTGSAETNNKTTSYQVRIITPAIRTTP